MPDKIRCIIIPQDRDPEVVDIENSLEAFQEVVGGLIEPCSYVFQDSPSVFVNEEGKVSGLLPNRAVFAGPEQVEAGYSSQIHWGEPVQLGELMDVLFGPILCVGFDAETGASISVTDEEIERVMERFSGPLSKISGRLAVAGIINGQYLNETELKEEAGR